MQKATGTRASELLELRQWADRETNGLSGWLICFLFDRAVTFWGTYVEGKLNEVDKHTFQPLHTLDELLYSEPVSPLQRMKDTFQYAVKRV
jgi:hypothetical protein